MALDIYGAYNVIIDLKNYMSLNIKVTSHFVSYSVLNAILTYYCDYDHVTSYEYAPQLEK